MSKVYVYTRNSNVEAFEKGSSRETQIKKCGRLLILCLPGNWEHEQ